MVHFHFAVKDAYLIWVGTFFCVQRCSLMQCLSKAPNCYVTMVRLFSKECYSIHGTLEACLCQTNNWALPRIVLYCDLQYCCYDFYLVFFKLFLACASPDFRLVELVGFWPSAIRTTLSSWCEPRLCRANGSMRSPSANRFFCRDWWGAGGKPRICFRQGSQSIWGA